jgi:hypothetical protein
MYLQVKVIEYCLVQPILKFKNTTNMVYVNFDPRLSLLILESSCMLKMELQVPIVTKALFFKKDHFTLVCDTLQVSKKYYICIYKATTILFTYVILVPIYIIFNANAVYAKQNEKSGKQHQFRCQTTIRHSISMALGSFNSWITKN